MTEPKPEVKKEDGDTTEKTRPRSQYHQRRNNNRDQGKRQSDRITTPRATFTGECSELEGAYFDFSTSYRADIYDTSISTMSGYVVRKYDNRDDIKTILSDLQMPMLEKPEALDSMAEDVGTDIYREDIKAYVKDKCALTKSAKKLYSLVLGQCTESLCVKMNGKEEWKEIDKKSDLVKVLKMINKIVFKVDTGKIST